jgi:NADH-quinone oxidoreductase subunit L
MAVFTSWILSLIALWSVINGNVFNQDIYTWITSGNFNVTVGFLVDQLTAVMLIVVTTVSLLVHIYSIGYMRGEEGFYRFFAYLSLFTFSMLMLVMANNFLQLYFGWEAVGLCSYLLIGFWYEKKSAADAGKKAFIVNRFGDFGFGLGVIMIFLYLGSLHYETVFSTVSTLQGMTVSICGHSVDLITVIALLLFCGAVGKSAQIPLHVWLPDAMEGPTPVSALIHAATMVTAGVFMVARTNVIFSLSPLAMNVVAITGGVTAIFAATIALVQNDIKRVVAYSTVSQLGYMFMACGVGAYAAGIFHLYTHAFFKALLFLCAGSVMHAMQGELDMQKMGGLKKYMPITYWTMLIASLSISGIPGLSGFFSKDEILWKAFSAGTATGKFVWVLGAIAALLTAFYSFRLIFVTFHGEFRGTHDQEHHLHESPSSMTIPLILLCVGAVAAGWVGIPSILGGHDGFAEYMSPVIAHMAGHGGEESHGTELAVMALSIIIGLAGIFVAYIMYVKKKELPDKLAGMFPKVYRILFNKYYVDEFYDAVIVRPVKAFSRGFINEFTDRGVIEGIVNGIPALVNDFAGRLSKFQSGILSHYSMIMAAGFVVIAVIVLFK